MKFLQVAGGNDRYRLLREGKVERVLVVQGGLLLSDGIVSLLTRESDLTVVNTHVNDEASLVDEIEKIQPSVLILPEKVQDAHLSQPFLLLKNCSILRVIVIDERKNLIQIFNKEEIEVARSVDLITAIRGERN